MKIEIGTIHDVLNIHAQIPEFDQKIIQEKITQRLLNTEHLLLIAKVDGEAVGYKLGYALSGHEFYSWLGGVLPEYRNQGIATALRQYQEQWASQIGYQSIHVKSMNCYPNMLHLLISSGYQIVGYEVASNQFEHQAKSQNITHGKILFYKKL